MKKWFLVLFTLWATSVVAGIEISQPQVRLLPPGVPNTSAYFKITNDGEKERILIAAQSKVAERVEIHSHVMTDGVMRMQKQDKLVIGAGAIQEFQPGGYHLMLFGLRKPLKENQEVTFTLYFSNGETVAVKAIVSSEIGQHQHHHH